MSKKEFKEKQFDLEEFKNSIFLSLEEAKALKISIIDFDGKSSLSDIIIICEGRSQSHCKGISNKVLEILKKEGFLNVGIEGENEGNWILLDYGDVILHIFHPEIRKYYDLEDLYKNHKIRNL